MEFDYIIVGGGSAGCVLAGRLSEDASVTVCLIEAGKSDDSAFVKAPLGFAAGAATGLNTYRFETEPQKELGGRKGFQPRGKVLGGSSSVNAMVYTRGHKSDYDQWAALGNVGWDFDSVLPYFKKSENSECIGENEYHGIGGTLNVSFLQSPSPINELFLQACELAGHRRTADYNGASQLGASHAQVTIQKGERCNSARAFVTPHLSRSNLTVLTGVTVDKVTIDVAGGEKQATGVICSQGTLRAKREVILSAGAYGSPQLLMLSGVGAKSVLDKHGIACLHELTGVGQNLQDHMTATFNWVTPYTPDLMGLSFKGIASLIRGVFEWRTSRTGIITTNVAESTAFYKVKDASPTADIQAALVVGIVDDHTRKKHFKHGYCLHVTLMRPASRGSVGLKSANAKDAPVIDPQYLSARDDVDTLLAGSKEAFKIMGQAPLLKYQGQLLYPVNVDDDADLEREIRRNADTEYHPVGTCKMGPASDAMAVVDAELRVHGVKGLRVIDASIMPNLISGNTNAPTIMIGEKGADMVKAARS